MIRALPLACLATTLVAGGASAQTFGNQAQPRQFPLLSSTGMTPLQASPLPQSGFPMAPSAPLPVLLEAGADRSLPADPVAQDVEPRAAQRRQQVGRPGQQRQRAGADREWDPPTIGEQVVLLSPSGNLAQGVVLTGLFSDLIPANGDR